MSTAQAPVYWTARQDGEPAAEWAARMARQYAASCPAALARLADIGQLDVTEHQRADLPAGRNVTSRAGTSTRGT